MKDIGSLANPVTILFFNNDAYRCPVIKRATRLLELNFSKYYGPRIKDAVHRHYTVTFGDATESVRMSTNFLVPKIGIWKYSRDHKNKNMLYLS